VLLRPTQSVSWRQCCAARGAVGQVRRAVSPKPLTMTMSSPWRDMRFSSCPYPTPTPTSHLLPLSSCPLPLSRNQRRPNSSNCESLLREPPSRSHELVYPPTVAPSPVLHTGPTPSFCHRRNFWGLRTPCMYHRDLSQLVFDRPRSEGWLGCFMDDHPPSYSVFS